MPMKENFDKMQERGSVEGKPPSCWIHFFCGKVFLEFLVTRIKGNWIVCVGNISLLQISCDL